MLLKRAARFMARLNLAIENNMARFKIFYVQEGLFRLCLAMME